MFKTGLVIGAAVGYLLGTRDGRERWEQIVAAARGFSSNPGVQRLTEEVNKTVSVGKERASTIANQKVEQASSTLAEKASQAKQKVASVGKDSSSDTPDTAPTITPTS
jgi:gas vesicle protein